MTYSWDVNGDGIFGDASGVNPTLSWSQLEALGINDGPATFNVQVKVTNAQGGSAISPATTLTVNDTLVSNLQLTLQAASINENGVASLSGSFTNPSAVDANSVVITWGDGSPSTTVNLAGGVTTFSGITHQYLDNPAGQPNGSYSISATVNDNEGNQASAGTSIQVNNVAPSAVIATPSATSINEGQSITLSGSFTDPGILDTHTVVVNWGDGSANTTVNLAAGVLTFSGVSHQYLDNPAGQPNGSFAISVTVTDKDGASGTGNTSVQVNAVPPTANLSGPGLGVPGQPRTFTFSATSPSPTDQAAGFTYAITWGDGTPVQTIPATAGNGYFLAVDHVYTAPGSYSVRVTATDDDSTSPAVSQAVSVQTVQMEGNTLAVGGTLGNDTITLTPADATGDIAVNVNGTTSFNGVTTFKPTDHILVYGQSGNDTIQLVSKKIMGTAYYITVPAFLYGGGTGNETLSVAGSTANNVVIGGGGTNQITGGLGRDILIAGLGASKLYAGSAGAILVGGWTDYDLTSTAMTYDKKLAALEAIMAEWGSADSYPTRVNDLSNGGGLNGSYLLNASTVHENGLVDTLFGTTGAGLDWFFAGVSDVVKNKKTGEVQTLIS